jgi:excisionase family DNA binding protein
MSGSATSGQLKRYTSIEAEALRLGLSLRTFSDLVRRGVVPSYRIGRRRILLVAEEIDRALEERFRREAPQAA